MTNIKCVTCGEIMSFANFMTIDDETTILECIVYLLTCVKCNTTFIPPLRFSKKATKKQIAMMKKTIEEVGE